jgi:starch-binding outer membrane protein, SusD/RagB family
MKRIQYIIMLACCLGLFSCRKVIDLYPQSNLSTGTYYSNYDEVKAALSGCYNGLQRPLLFEWQLTELRSDNSKQGQPGSTAATNRDLSDLDMFVPATTHQAIYNYWLSSYNNIRNCNIVIEKLGAKYDPASGNISFDAIDIPIAEKDRRQLAGEAMFIRAYHYFNLVRLFGGVFLVHKSITPAEAKLMNRATVADIYKLIEADLKTGAASMNALTYSQQTATANVANLGRASSWAAKALLAKVYLTLGRKGEAIPLLQDVIANSGHKLVANYANVFSIANEVNEEILFTVRFKAGGLGLGSSFANTFAPIQSGNAVINGDGDGLNYPTYDLDTLTNGDGRKPTLMAVYGTGASAKLYVKKFLSPVTLVDDAENDWPVLRYSDVLLMLAEAQGFSPASLQLISQTRQRAGLTALDPAVVNTVALFEQALSTERRVEFAFENQRWFDLVRFNTTLTTVTAEQSMKDHFTREYFSHYRLYTPPAPTLALLHQSVTKERLLLPIPQREIDTNTQIVIPQNPSY